MKLEQQTWSSPSPFLGTKEFDSWKNVQSTWFFTASFGFTGAANAAAGIRLLPLPRLPFLPYEGAGNRCRHSQFGSSLGEKLPEKRGRYHPLWIQEIGFWGEMSRIRCNNNDVLNMGYYRAFKVHSSENGIVPGVQRRWLDDVHMDHFDH